MEWFKRILQEKVNTDSTVKTIPQMVVARNEKKHKGKHNVLIIAEGTKQPMGVVH